MITNINTLCEVIYKSRIHVTDKAEDFVEVLMLHIKPCPLRFPLSRLVPKESLKTQQELNL